LPISKVPAQTMNPWHFIGTTIFVDRLPAYEQDILSYIMTYTHKNTISKLRNAGTMAFHRCTHLNKLG